MHDILFSFVVAAPPARVFDVVARPEGLNAWWPSASAGEPVMGATYTFEFGPRCRWRAMVLRCEAGRTMEWRLIEADEDWRDTRVSFQFQEEAPGTRVEFAHRGWRLANQHYRVSAFCWAAYLRLLRQHIECGDVIPYSERHRV